MKTIFEQEAVNELIARINKLTPYTKPNWGKMNVGQMLAHCNVTCEMAYENIHKAPNGFVKLILKLFVKEQVVGNKPYKKNSQTAPAFIIIDPKDFEKEKARLIEYLDKTLKLGANYFEGRESLSFGKLTAAQWNTMFQKHLNHHLAQFGV